MIQNKIKIYSIKNFLLQCIAFTLPLNKNLVPLLIVFTIILWFVEGNFNEKLQVLKSKFFLLAICLYLLHLVGMLYTTNYKAGGFDLEQKLSLLILPLLFFSETQVNNLQSLKILKSFVVGCVLAGLICLTNAAFKYYISGNIEGLFYTQFSPIMHTSYFAMYLCFAIILILFNDGIMQNQTLKLATVLFLTLPIVLSSSKSGLFSLGLIILAKLMYDVFIKKSYLRVLVFSSLLIITALSIYLVFPKAFLRVSEMKQDITSPKSEVNTNTNRIAIWKLSSTIISNNYLIGVGTGDVKDVLNAAYEKQTIAELAEKKLNAHNQYLQTFMALGLPGILILLSLLSVIAYFTWSNNMLDGALLTAIIAFNLLFESMLETQAGVVFIAFFLMYYFSLATKNGRLKNLTIAS
jgi:O-antigen ligase